MGNRSSLENGVICHTRAEYDSTPRRDFNACEGPPEAVFLISWTRNGGKGQLDLCCAQAALMSQDGRCTWSSECITCLFTSAALPWPQINQIPVTASLIFSVLPPQTHPSLTITPDSQSFASPTFSFTRSSKDQYGSILWQ